ncbi:MAG: TolC family protein, partial [Nitrospinota bacterium]
MLNKIWILGISVCVLFPSYSFSGSEKSEPNAVEQIQLTLQECIALTFKNNLNIQIEKITPLIAETLITRGEGEFDPTFSTSASVNKTMSPSASTFAAPKVGKVETIAVSAGVNKKYKTGTEINFQAGSMRSRTNSRFQGINPQYDTSLKFSVSQNLLKNFGTEINSATIQIAAINWSKSKLSFKNTVLQILTDVQLTYLDLVFAKKDLEVKKENLNLAIEFENRVKTQVEIGVLPPIEITQAKAEVALREEEIIIARSTIQNIEDKLKQFVNLSPDWSAFSLHPADVPFIEPAPSTLDEDILEALEKRPDYLEAVANSKTLRIDISKKKNLLLPALGVSGNLELTGLSGSAQTSANLDGTVSQSQFGGGYGKSYEDILNGEHINWNLGVSLTIPLGNKAAKSDLLEAEFNARKNEAIIRKLKQDVSIQVREARRRVDTAVKRIDVTKISGKLAKEKLAAEETKFKLGMSTSFNVLEFQRDLSLAKTRELLAVSDYNKAII